MASYVSLCHHLSAPREVAMENTDQRALVEMWRIRLEDARARHKTAHAAVDDARELQSQIPSPDGSFALQHALLAQHRALTELRRVLTVFNDLVCVMEKFPRQIKGCRGGMGTW